MAKDFIAAITLGTSQIVGIVGRKEPDGVKVLAYATEQSNGCIRKGVVSNIDKTANCIRSIKTKLDKQLAFRDLGKISKVYVGIGGQSIRSVKNTVSKVFVSSTKIDRKIVKSMQNESENVTYPNAEVFNVISQEYKIGSDQTTDPVGTEGKSIRCEYINVIANPRLRDRVWSSFKDANVSIADTRLIPLVLGENLITEDEKRSGCILIDFGAETTTVSIYRNNILRHLAVIPLGSNTINKDFDNGMQIDYDWSEAFKCEQALAQTDENEQENDKLFIINDIEYKASELQPVVEARIKEILLNVTHQIELSGFSINELLGGIIITGRGSALKALETAIQKNIYNVKIRNAQQNFINISSISEDFDKCEDFVYLPALALLAAKKTTENCNAMVKAGDMDNMFDGKEPKPDTQPYPENIQPFVPEPEPEPQPEPEPVYNEPKDLTDDLIIKQKPVFEESKHVAEPVIPKEHERYIQPEPVREEKVEVVSFAETPTPEPQPEPKPEPVYKPKAAEPEEPKHTAPKKKNGNPFFDKLKKGIQTLTDVVTEEVDEPNN
ncbi:MAG: cell division protein FtsA [Bacteroidaceae bacterium]|nr:cell division protein FtsA [Bacteroidaceae bacterium]